MDALGRRDVEGLRARDRVTLCLSAMPDHDDPFDRTEVEAYLGGGATPGLLDEEDWEPPDIGSRPDNEYAQPLPKRFASALAALEFLENEPWHIGRLIATAAGEINVEFQSQAILRRLQRALLAAVARDELGPQHIVALHTLLGRIEKALPGARPEREEETGVPERPSTTVRARSYVMTQPERALVEQFVAEMSRQGVHFQIEHPVPGDSYADAVCVPRRIVVEAKAETANHHVWQAIGQVSSYARRLGSHGAEFERWVLLPGLPSDVAVADLRSFDISCVIPPFDRG